MLRVISLYIQDIWTEHYGGLGGLLRDHFRSGGMRRVFLCVLSRVCNTSLSVLCFLVRIGLVEYLGAEVSVSVVTESY
jgi:hypothetical protein